MRIASQPREMPVVEMPRLELPDADMPRVASPRAESPRAEDAPDDAPKKKRHGDGALNNAKFFWSCAKCTNTRQIVGAIIKPGRMETLARRFDNDPRPEITVPRFLLGALIQPMTIPVSLVVAGEEIVRAGIIKGAHGVGVAVGLGHKGR